MAVSEYARRRLDNAMVLRAVTFTTAMYSLLYSIQLKSDSFTRSWLAVLG